MRKFLFGVLAALACASPALTQNAPNSVNGCEYVLTPSPTVLSTKQTARIQCDETRKIKVVTTPASGSSQDVNITGVGGNAVTTTMPVSGTVAATQSGTWTVQPGNTANTTPWLVGGYSTIITASTTRINNTTTYTANTGWALLTSGATYGTFSSVCRANGGKVLIPQIDIYSSANPATKLQGVLWLFDTVVGTPVSDNATFNIAAGDFANLTGNIQGFPFTLTSVQAAGAANSGVSLTGTTYHANCASGATAIYYMIQVVNAYVPASSEVLTFKLHTVAAN